MAWLVPLALLAVLGLALWQRRAELRRMRGVLEVRAEHEDGPADAVLHLPVVDLDRCLGCGTCVAACPENGVLDLVHGQASVVRASRCVGHGHCEAECPVGAIELTVARAEQRRDLPALDGLEAAGVPGLFLAGEVTARALIRGAVDQGVEAARRAAGRASAAGDDAVDLAIVGAGPAGLACALEARRLGLRFAVLDQDPTLGGTVARYPRKKLVLTEPLELPLVGRLTARSFEKEELIAIWQAAAADHLLPIYPSTTVEAVRPQGEGFALSCARDGARRVLRARSVCMAVGRRGTPRRLGVPGEELPHVAYGLSDAASYRGRRALVVGGGDSAVEAALALAEQPGTEVTLSYRRASFVRIRARNEERLREAVARGALRLQLESTVREIRAHEVVLDVGARDRGTATTGAVAATAAPIVGLAVDHVFVCAGGEPPTALLESAGVSFDPEERASRLGDAGEQPSADRSLVGSLVAVVAATAFCVLHHDYYAAPDAVRAGHPSHAALRSGFGLGLWLGVAALGCVVANLAYLLRRNGWLRWGALRGWMDLHVVTGVLAVLCAMLHGGLRPDSTPGGHGFWALVLLLATGAIGRWLYAWLPRASNGAELDGAAARDQMRQMAERCGREIDWRGWQDELVEVQWERTFCGRVRGLFADRRLLRDRLAELDEAAVAAGAPARERAALRAVAARAQRSALVGARLEDLRALLATWRYLHRWVAALMVLLVVVHVWQVMAHGAFSFGLVGMP